jgi:hypothetical protein
MTLQQRTYKIQQQKPTYQSYLYKDKHASHFNSRISYLHKFRRYWCVLVRDYMAFYKHPDDKVPKDFLLLKDFYIKSSSFSTSSSTFKHNFVIGDKTKQLEHEFYAETYPEFQEWVAVLNDLRIKLANNENTSSNLSLSSQSLSAQFSNSGQYENGNVGHNSEPGVQQLSGSLPSSSILNKIKHGLPLTTIVGSNEDINGTTAGSKRNSLNANETTNNEVNSQAANGMNNNGSINNGNSSSHLQQDSCQTSRESSPGMYMASRDSSPSLNYRMMDLVFISS